MEVLINIFVLFGLFFEMSLVFLLNRSLMLRILESHTSQVTAFRGFFGDLVSVLVNLWVSFSTSRCNINVDVEMRDLVIDVSQAFLRGLKVCRRFVREHLVLLTLLVFGVMAVVAFPKVTVDLDLNVGLLSGRRRNRFTHQVRCL